MANASQCTRKAPAAVIFEFVEVFSAGVLNSVKQDADLQKKALNTAGEQTAEWVAAWKKTLSYVSVAPLSLLFDVAGNAVQTVIESHKSAADLVVEQSKDASHIVKVRAEAYSKIADGMTSIIQESVERSIEAQKTILEFVGEQNKAVFESIKQQFGATSGPASLMVDQFQSGADAALATQKSFLNIATVPFVVSAKN